MITCSAASAPQHHRRVIARHAASRDLTDALYQVVAIARLVSESIARLP